MSFVLSHGYAKKFYLIAVVLNLFLKRPKSARLKAHIANNFANVDLQKTQSFIFFILAQTVTKAF